MPKHINKSNEKAVIVFGGAGYIGSHTCKELKKSGYNPIAYDDLSNGFEYLVKWGPLEKGDIHDIEKVKEVIKKYQPIAAIHFAASMSVEESTKNPYKYYYNNTYGTLTLLKAMEELGLKNIIFSSTAAVYGEPKTKTIKEDQPKNPVNPYGNSKLMVEQILKDFDNFNGIKHIALRYFNAAGADIDAETGCDQVSTTNLIPVIMNVISGKQKKLKIFGTDYKTKDGTCIRDYIHVTDLAKAHILALEYLLKSQKSDVFNLGTGRGSSVKEVVDSVRRVLKYDLPVEYANRRAGDPPVLVANSDKAKKILNWTPIYSDMDNIILTAYNWKIKS
ncbi:UDP-glucose 4-epimerase GalE [Pseudomonadota bacterium]